MRDLEDAVEYIARDSRVFAAALARKAHRAALSLSTFAERGRVVPEYDDLDRRQLLVGNYRLL